MQCERSYCTADEDRSKPVKYSTSEAAGWRAEYSRFGNTEVGDNAMPSVQPFIVVFSAAVFLLYFTIFREENDIDERLSMPLSEERIAVLEETQLRVLLQYYRELGRDTTAVEKKLKEKEQINHSTQLVTAQ